MLDTVTFGRDWPLRNDPQHPLPDRRKFRMSDITVRIADDRTKLWAAEASLPRVLFGHNGGVIETQAQQDAALAKFSEILAPYVDVPDVNEWVP